MIDSLMVEFTDVYRVILIYYMQFTCLYQIIEFYSIW